MYEGPTVYKTNITNYHLIIFTILIIVLVIFLTLLSIAKILKKADKKFISGFIPFYNLYLLVDISKISKIYFLLFFIPIINIFSIIIISKNLASVFNKKMSFTLGLIFLPIVYYPILAFSKDRYVGINNQKVEEIVLTELVKEKIETDEKATVLKTDTNISIGVNKKSDLNNVMEDGTLKVDTSILDNNKATIPEYVTCPNCKNKIKKGANVCFMCGYKFE